MFAASFAAGDQVLIIALPNSPPGWKKLAAASLSNKAV